MGDLTTEERAMAAARAIAQGARVDVADLLAEIPPGLAEVHPTWIPAEAPEVEAALAGRGQVRAPWRRWLRRRLYGHLVAMLDGLPRDLVPEIESIGRRRLALATKAAPRGADRLLATRLGSGQAAAFLEEVAAPALPAEIGVAVRELAGLDPDGPLLFCAGARHLGPAVAALGGDWPRRLAQRLPRPLGERLLDEVAAGRPLLPGATEKLAKLLRRRA